MAEKQRILIVDDDANIAELISLYLMKECYETQIVGDGEEALKVFPVFNPHLILLDLMLPGIDGYQVCQKLRTTSQVPIIMLSAKGEIFDKVLGLELGADDYMIKPFDSKELVARVKAVLRRYQAAAQVPSLASDQQGEYVEKDDFLPLEGEKNGSVILEPGDFLVCCPYDGHRTAVAAGQPEDIRKAIFKVRIEKACE